jgi:hypothetical protein
VVVNDVESCCLIDGVIMMLIDSNDNVVLFIEADYIYEHAFIHESNDGEVLMML